MTERDTLSIANVLEAHTSFSPALLSMLKSRAGLLAILKSNHALYNTLAASPELLTAIAATPALLSVFSNNPGLLGLVAANPSLLSEIITDPTLFIKKRASSQDFPKPIEPLVITTTKSLPGKLIKPPTKEVFTPSALKGTIQQQAPPKEKKALTKKGFLPSQTSPLAHKLSPSLIAQAKAIAAKLAPIPKTTVTALIPYVTSERRPGLVPIQTLPVGKGLKPDAIIFARSMAANPALLALLGAAALGTTKGRIFSTSGGLKDLGIELETESERQPDALLETNQEEGAGEINEATSISGPSTCAINPKVVYT